MTSEKKAGVAAAFSLAAAAILGKTGATHLALHAALRAVKEAPSDTDLEHKAANAYEAALKAYLRKDPASAFLDGVNGLLSLPNENTFKETGLSRLLDSTGSAFLADRSIAADGVSKIIEKTPTNSAIQKRAVNLFCTWIAHYIDQTPKDGMNAIDRILPSLPHDSSFRNDLARIVLDFETRSVRDAPEETLNVLSKLLIDPPSDASLQDRTAKAFIALIKNISNKDTPYPIPGFVLKSLLYTLKEVPPDSPLRTLAVKLVLDSHKRLSESNAFLTFEVQVNLLEDVPRNRTFEEQEKEKLGFSARKCLSQDPQRAINLFWNALLQTPDERSVISALEEPLLDYAAAALEADPATTIKVLSAFLRKAPQGRDIEDREKNALNAAARAYLEKNSQEAIDLFHRLLQEPPADRMIREVLEKAILDYAPTTFDTAPAATFALVGDCLGTAPRGSALEACERGTHRALAAEYLTKKPQEAIRAIQMAATSRTRGAAFLNNVEQPVLDHADTAFEENPESTIKVVWALAKRTDSDSAIETCRAKGILNDLISRYGESNPNGALLFFGFFFKESVREPANREFTTTKILDLASSAEGARIAPAFEAVSDILLLTPKKEGLDPRVAPLFNSLAGKYLEAKPEEALDLLFRQLSCADACLTLRNQARKAFLDHADTAFEANQTKTIDGLLRIHDWTGQDDDDHNRSTIKLLKFARPTFEQTPKKIMNVVLDLLQEAPSGSEFENQATDVFYALAKKYCASQPRAALAVLSERIEILPPESRTRLLCAKALDLYLAKALEEPSPMRRPDVSSSASPSGLNR
ncbi:MAG: hypothetical protein PHS57_06930 [Alphaproteobacteria bacterium]|nr:hypothetical protein [Alphaproteobacteria bacterium]